MPTKPGNTSLLLPRAVPLLIHAHKGNSVSDKRLKIQDYLIALGLQPYSYVRMKVKPLSYIKSCYWYPRQVEVMNLLLLGNVV